MKSKNIYIIRHGQTDFNLKKMVQGRGVDSDLNETGKRQARLFYDVYHNVRFDKIYTSSLKRTQQSVQDFIEDGVPYESLDGLDEISWGDHEGQPYDEIRHAAYLAGLAEWTKGNINSSVANGESPVQVMNRQKAAFEYILSQEGESNIIVATHGRAMRIMICWMLGRPLQDAEYFKHENLCLYLLKYDPESGFESVRMADVAHLKV